MRKILNIQMIITFFLLSGGGWLFSQQVEDLPKLIKSFKKDPRGPYKGIFWFCPDGSIIPAKERCEEPGGIQHALHKDIVKAAQKNTGVYLGQILAGTDYEDFLDTENYFSRLKQYQMEKFLQAADDGWIMRRAQFYRGAFQAEDEERWGKVFLEKALADDDLLAAQFYLLRQAARDLPHQTESNLLSRIRAISKTIGDTIPEFMDIRIKIHGQPDASDLDTVKAFYEANKDSLDTDIEKMFKKLTADLKKFYFTPALIRLERYRKAFAVNTPPGYQLRQVLKAYQNETASDEISQDIRSERCRSLAHLLWVIRKNLPLTDADEKRLSLVDLSLEAEDMLFSQAGKWQPENLSDLLRKQHALAKAAAATGLLEIWEWEELEQRLLPNPAKKTLLFSELQKIDNAARRAVEWATGMVNGVYEPTVSLFYRFEPLAYGFVDDRIRGSVLLSLGETAGKLADVVTRYANISNQMFDLSNPNSARGLNPGFAKGELVVVSGPPTKGLKYSTEKIYVMQKAPSDLKPVAGIATVSEGNAVSHVQLLARNLGIPNAVVSLENLSELEKYAGQQVFYAVSPGGTVLMKPAIEMSEAERALVEKRTQTRRTVTISTDQIDLNTKNILEMANLRSSDSGKLCGPKAANLGQLSSLFPGKVPPGLVIPFGIFYEHFQQNMPGETISYWQFLKNIFARAEVERALGTDAAIVEKDILAGLAELRKAINIIPLFSAFEAELEKEFERVFQAKIGMLGMFIRSDTNMEDLKEFTGAGLNLTVANILSKEKILQAIRDVWASPFRERGYKWRQRYLKNPENVYPSLLLLPTVNADKSGVMITTGIVSKNPDDITVAFNYGVGGAVDGQVAETYLLRVDGQDELLSPARAPKFNKVLLSGGIKKRFTDFYQPILSGNERFQLRQMAAEVLAVLPGTPGIETDGPFDVELGFWNEAIWLFQVRPFVENKQAQSSGYLQTLDPEVVADQEILLNASLF